MFWHIEIIAGSYWKSWGIFTEISRQQAVIINDYSASVRPLLLPVVSDKSQEIFDTAWIKFCCSQRKSRQTMQVKKSWRGCTGKPKLACQNILHINIGKICLAWATKCPQDPLLPLSRIIFTFSLSHPLSVLIMLLLRYQCLISHPDSKDLIFYFSFLSFNC